MQMGYQTKFNRSILNLKPFRIVDLTASVPSKAGILDLR